MTKTELKELIKECLFESMNESDSTKEKAKLVYSNLKKREFEYRELTKKSKDSLLLLRGVLFRSTLELDISSCFIDCGN